MMFKRLFLLAMVAASLSAKAETFTSEFDRLHVKCKGYIDKFVINLETVMKPGVAESAITSLELGYVVKTWAGRDMQWDDSVEVQGGDVALEGAIQGGIGQYTYALPGIFSEDHRLKSFSTKLTLKTGIVSGKVAVNCEASIRKLKQERNASY